MVATDVLARGADRATVHPPNPPESTTMQVPDGFATTAGSTGNEVTRARPTLGP